MYGKLNNLKISVIIPTLNAGKNIRALLNKLLEQTIIPDEIIVIDSSSADNTKDICLTFPKVRFIQIEKEDFDHGQTRDKAARLAIGDYILFMTQDAIPADNYYIENLIRPLVQKNIAMSSGRQIARIDARYAEKLTRIFNYPEHDFVRCKKDIPEYGIKTFFASDVCSAYRKRDYIKCGGFPYPIPVGEDMIMAAKFIYAGYSIAYVADARVIHSHNFTLKQQFKRNFDIGVYLTMYKNYFKDVSLNQEGIKMVKFVLLELMKKGKMIDIIYYICECISKLLGNKLGLNFRLLHINYNKN